MSQISVDSVIPQSGTTITIGGSGDTVNLGSGVSTNGFLPSAISVSGTDFQFDSGYGSTATAYGCRAWVNFNGTGTVAIRDSGNVSSITDNATGKYAVNFTNSMPDASYSVCGTTVGNTITTYFVSVFSNKVALSTSSFEIQLRNTGNNVDYDTDVVNIAVFR